MQDFLFDGVNKVIKEPIGTGNTTYSVKRDIYSAWKRWVIASGSQFEQAFIVEGGTPIGSTGLFTGATFILINGWKLMTADHDHQLFVEGNIYSDDGIVSVPNPIGNSTLFISSSVNAQGISTGNSGGTINVESDWTNSEKKQIRDALGVDGDKKVAKGGQLQEKSEYPFNNTINTSEINN